MRRTTHKKLLVLAVASAVALGSAAALGKGPPSGGGGGGHTETQGNNLSFPAIAADGFSISPLAAPSFAVPYSGEYPGLTDSEVMLLEATGPWYAQKTEGNVWQADFGVNTSGTTVEVNWIDWGDKIESSSPMLRRPFRLELALYKQLEASMTAYTMAVLEYPSSANELQGTNTSTYDSNWATVATNSWTLVIQRCEGEEEPLTWTGSDWDECEAPVAMPFGVELNVGGKYIFGGSQGGWKPTQTGWYRITFFDTNTDSDVDLRAAEVGNYADFGAVVPAPAIAAESDEGPVATPVVDSEHNLTYVDVEVISGGGGGGGKPR